MISEAINATLQSGVDRLSRNGENSALRRSEEPADERVGGGAGDTARFTAEALELSRRVEPTGQAESSTENEPQGRGQEADPFSSQFLDIRV